MGRTILLAPLILGAMTLALSGQAQFTVYNTGNSGIASNTVSDVQFSPTGVWVGTAAGLNHFNGTTWTVRNTTNSNIPHNVVTDMAIDADDDLWLWNYDQGCSRFNGSSFEHFTTADGLGSNSGSNIMFIGGAIWAGTYSGVSRFEGDAWMTYNSGNSGLPGNDVRECDVDSAGGLWVPTYGGGIGYLLNGIWSNDMPGYNVLVARALPNGHVWVGTTVGLVDHYNDEWTVYTSQNSILGSDDVRGIEVGNNGELVIATRYGGLNIIYPDGTWSSYDTFNSNLPTNQLLHARMDADGRIWVATYNGGLAVMDHLPANAPQHVAEPPMNVRITCDDGLLAIIADDCAVRATVFDAPGRCLWSSGWANTLRHDLDLHAGAIVNVRVEGADGRRVVRKMLVPGH